MEYIGAADYYFWQGVKKGLKQSVSSANKIYDTLCIFGENNTSKACYEAFRWGLCLGMTLTKVEYTKLTTYPKPDKIEPVVTKKPELTTSKSPSHIIGNC